MQFDLDPVPALDFRAFHRHDGGPTAAAGKHPGSEPGGNLYRDMTEHIAAGDMDPDGGRFVALWWIGDQQERLPWLQPFDDRGAGSENGAVHVGPET